MSSTNTLPTGSQRFTRLLHGSTQSRYMGQKSTGVNSGDHQHIPNAGEHQRTARVENHRLVIHRHELLAKAAPGLERDYFSKRRLNAAR